MSSRTQWNLLVLQVLPIIRTHLSSASYQSSSSPKNENPIKELYARDLGCTLLLRIILKPSPPTPCQPSIHTKIIFHKTGLWCWKGWGLLSWGMQSAHTQELLRLAFFFPCSILPTLLGPSSLFSTIIIITIIIIASVKYTWIILFTPHNHPKRTY